MHEVVGGTIKGSIFLEGEDIIAEAKKNGDIDRMAVKWLGRPAGDLPN